MVRWIIPKTMFDKPEEFLYQIKVVGLKMNASIKIYVFCFRYTIENIEKMDLSRV